MAESATDYPLHGNRKGKPERGANLEMSRQIMENWRVLIPVGAGICKMCRTDHLDTVRVSTPEEVLCIEQSEELPIVPIPISEILSPEPQASSEFGSPQEVCFALFVLVDIST
ncbi:hypothetical protein ACROYT_G008678 [Oculina patagonica]